LSFRLSDLANKNEFCIKFAFLALPIAVFKVKYGKQRSSQIADLLKITA
jgi:hypothetical protein